MEEKIKKLEQELIESLPQVPYILDLAGNAISWVKEELEESEIIKSIQTAVDVSKYAKEVSEVNFFKFHLVIAALLMNIPKAIENEKFNSFKTASGSIENTLKKISINEKLAEERGCFKGLLLQLAPLALEDEEAFVVFLFGILQDLKEITAGMSTVNASSPILAEDYIKTLGYSYVIDKISISVPSLLFSTRDVINEINIILNQVKY